MGEWREIQLKGVLEVVRNGTSNKQVALETAFPVTRIETISEGRIDISKVGFVLSVPDSYRLKKGDILFSNINSLKHIGKVAYNYDNDTLYHGMNLLLLRFKEDIDKKYMYYVLCLHKAWFEKMAAQAINQASINQSTLSKLQVKLPTSLTEQTRIAQILSKADEAIAHTEALIAKYQRIKTGLMQDLLTRGIDENGNIRSEETHSFKDSPLGRIPVEWEVVELEKLVSAPIVYGILMPGYGFDGGVPVIKVKNIFDDGIDTSDLLLTSPTIAKQFERSALKENDLLFTIRGTVGRCAFVPRELEGGNITQDTARIRLVGINPLFVRYSFHLPKIQSYIDLHTLGLAVKGINLKDLRKMLIPLPSSDESDLIANRIKSIDSNILAKIECLVKLQSLKRGLMQDLLSGPREAVEKA